MEQRKIKRASAYRRGFTHQPSVSKARGFTLLELIIVVAILAIIGLALILVINPAEILRSARDSQRMSDLAALNRAIEISFSEQAQQGGVLDPDGPAYGSGTSTIYCAGDADQRVFVSVPSDNGETPPTPPPGWNWKQTTQTNVGLVTGSGWMPVDITAAAGGSPISNLPLDPQNTFASGSYYTYTCSANPRFALTAKLEAQKYRADQPGSPMAIDGGVSSDLYEIGTNVKLTPDFADRSLVLSLALDEGAGTAAQDSSQYNRDGTLEGFAFDAFSGWRSGGSCKSGSCLLFGGNDSLGDDRVTTANILNPTTTPFTAEAWVNADSFAHLDVDVDRAIILKQAAPNGINWLVIQRLSASDFRLRAFSGAGVTAGTTNWNAMTGQWHHIAVSFDGTTSRLYLDGVFEASSVPAALISSTGPMYIGRHNNPGTTNEEWDGLIDELRIYNRALSEAEIKVHYQALP